jgi:hypothetical protein
MEFMIPCVTKLTITAAMIIKAKKVIKVYPFGCAFDLYNEKTIVKKSDTKNAKTVIIKKLINSTLLKIYNIKANSASDIPTIGTANHGFSRLSNSFSINFLMSAIQSIFYRYPQP